MFLAKPWYQKVHIDSGIISVFWEGIIWQTTDQSSLDLQGSFSFIYLFMHLLFYLDSLQTAPGPTAAAVAHCGSGGPLPWDHPPHAGGPFAVGPEGRGAKGR